MARRSWVQIDGKLIPKEEYCGVVPSRMLIIQDIKPYRSTITGEEIGSRSTHRNHLRQHGMVELGNEYPKERRIPDAPDLKADLARVVYGR